MLIMKDTKTQHEDKCCTLISWVQQILGPSLRNWRTLIHWNVFPTIFHNDHISQGLWKVVRTTFQCIDVSNRRETILKSRNDMGQIFPAHFGSFWLSYINARECISWWLNFKLVLSYNHIASTNFQLQAALTNYFQI